MGLIDAQGLYTAPAGLPSSTAITISATTQATPAKSASAQVTLLSDISVVLAPPAPSVELGATQRFSASISSAGKPDTTIRWSLAGAACPFACGSMDALGNYTAPQNLPAPASVSVVATSAADSSRQSTATVHLTSSFTLTLSGPASLPTGGSGEITATLTAVAGSSPNPALTWNLSSPGCSSSACGVLSPSTSILWNGNVFTTTASYAAPSAAPSPANVNISVASVADSSKSATLAISLAQGVSVALSPVSAARATLHRLTLTVQVAGSGFVASSPGPGSVLLLGGAARTTTCTSTTECTAPVSASDVATAGTLSIQIRNPDNSASNEVSLVIAAPSTADEVISLTSSSPSADGRDIIVVEATTAGVSAPGASVNLDVAALGLFSTAANSCTLAGNPVVLARPASGSATADLCVFSSSGLDASMNYVISGSGDVSVISCQPAGLGIIHLTLQIPAAAVPGPRTLFIENANKDKAAASGALEVQ